jgi:hypothetical protein
LDATCDFEYFEYFKKILHLVGTTFVDTLMHFKTSFTFETKILAKNLLDEGSDREEKERLRDL